jgi:hypothetical protein
MAILSETSARKVLAAWEFDLRECVTSAWARWRRDFSPLLPACTARGRANIIWELMVDEAKKRFPGVTVNEDQNRFVLMFHEKANVVFKKLGDEGMPSNYPTQTALEFSCQPELPHMPEFARITIGYELNGLGTELTAVTANCFDGPNIVWRYDLPERPAKRAVVSLKKKAQDAERKPARRVRGKANTSDLRVIEGGKKDDKN